MNATVTIGNITLTLEMTSEEANVFGAYLGKIAPTEHQNALDTGFNEDQANIIVATMKEIYRAFQNAS